MTVRSSLLLTRLQFKVEGQKSCSHVPPRSSITAAWAGTAQVIIPHNYDQFYWAHRVQQLSTELRQIVDVLYPIQLELEQLISAKPALAGNYEMGSISLYRTARREGMTV